LTVKKRGTAPNLIFLFIYQSTGAEMEETLAANRRKPLRRPVARISGTKKPAGGLPTGRS
jgi:hypothetical protein